MKQLGQLCAGVILALSLTLSTYAGHISCPGVTDDPPPTTEETLTGEMPNGDTATGEMQNGVTDSLIWLIFSLL